MTALTPLTDLMPDHLDEEPRREQRAWIDEEQIPVVLQATLERTAIVRRLPDRGDRELVNLQRVQVDAETLVWERSNQYSWELMSPTSRPNAPSMRLRRLRGRDTARRNKKLAAQGVKAS